MFVCLIGSRTCVCLGPELVFLSGESGEAYNILLCVLADSLILQRPSLPRPRFGVCGYDRTASPTFMKHVARDTMNLGVVRDVLIQSRRDRIPSRSWGAGGLNTETLLLCVDDAAAGEREQNEPKIGRAHV